ncbi:hypothetical protein ABQE69_13125 [Mycolicibacillus trivialis]
MKKLATGTAIAVGLLMGGAAVASADDVIVYDGDTGVPWSWATKAECISDGPDMHLDNVGEDEVYQYWYCLQHDDGLWYLHNSDQPTHEE